MYEKVIILGFAKSGFEAALLLANYSNSIYLVDRASKESHNKENIDTLTNLGVKLCLGDEPLDILEGTSLIVKNPGVPSTHEYIKYARENNIEVINEIELAYRLNNKDVTYVGITGSNGKTTTTTLTYEMLKRSNRNILLGGNIGVPLCKLVPEVSDGDIILLEVSSHQLLDLKEFKCDIAVLLNIYETHVDFFGTYEHYRDNKFNIFNNMTDNDISIINKNSDEVMKNISKVNGNITYFKDNNIDMIDNVIYYNDEAIINKDDILLLGEHNIENILASIIVAKHFNVSNEDIVNVLENFGGVSHRCENVPNRRGITVINDSKSTNTTSTKMALNSFDKPIVLMIGGMDRKETYDINDLTKGVKHVVAFGEIGMELKEKCNNIGINCTYELKLEDAVKKAYDMCEQTDILLFSPGFASHDEFTSYEQRGELFKETIKNI